MMNKKLDVLLMNDNNLEVVGGAEESTKIIIDGIKAKYKVGVIFPGKAVNQITKVDNIFTISNYTRLKHLIKKPLLFLSYIREVKKIILQTKPKIIHTQAQASFFIVAFLKKIRMIPSDIYLIHTERGLFTKYNSLLRNIFYFFMKELDVLVTTTNFNMKHWKSALKKKNLSLKYSIIENTAGKLFEVFDNNLDHIDSEYLTIGFSGRFADWKNWPLAVEISKKLNDIIGDRLKVKMTVGCLDSTSLIKTQEMFEYLNSLLNDRFIGEINVDMEQMNKFYYEVDIFVLTSNYNTESFGRTLVEAMSRKTVVLTTDAGGSVEVVGNPQNVHETSKDFVDHILKLYNDQNLMNKEKENNLKRVKEKYSLANNINKHLELYERIINDELHTQLTDNNR